MEIMKNYFIRRRLRRSLALLLTMATFPLQILVFVTLRICSKAFPIRYAWLITPRIGHLAANFDLMLTNRENGFPHKHQIPNFWIPSQEHVCNRFLLKLIKRRVNVIPRWLFIVSHALNLRLSGGKLLNLDSGTDRDVHNLLDLTAPTLQFSDSEIQNGLSFLKSAGLSDCAPFVCLNIRDSTYLLKTYPANDWSYHDYRDSSIENYVLAVSALLDRGYYVFRMGAHVSNPFPFEHPKVIDYASNGMRSDFLDVFLGAHCAFCISSGTGFDAVPYIFRRPIAYVNVAPVGFSLTSSERFSLLFKDHYDISTGLRMPLRSIFDAGVAFSADSVDYKQKKVELRENTPNQIRDAVVEMMDFLEKNADYLQSSESMQMEFRQLFKVLVDSEGFGQHGQIKARYCVSELKKNPSFLV